MGVQAGPLWLRGLNQKAHSQTLPAGTVGANSMSAIVREVDPSKVQSAGSAGGDRPDETEEAGAADPGRLAPAGGVGALSFSRSRRPITETISTTGGSSGGLIGATVPERGVSPRSSRC